MNSVAFDKSKAFAVRIVRLYSFLRSEKREYVMSRQLLKCGTSVGANLAEAECAISRSDFLSKVYIAFKEANETLYWLELLHTTNYLTNGQFDSLKRDCDELRRILAAITKTTKDSR